MGLGLTCSIGPITIANTCASIPNTSENSHNLNPCAVIRIYTQNEGCYGDKFLQRFGLVCVYFLLGDFYEEDVGYIAFHFYFIRFVCGE